MKNELRHGIELLEISLNEKAILQLEQYIELLHKWNRVYNLTAIRDPQKMISHHLLDNLAVLKHLWDGRWLDVGTGAGLPGIVLAIAQPDWHFSLIDSNSKKTSFVQQAIIDLKLNNIVVHCARVEIWQPTEVFDGIISRAFSELGDFINCSRHLISKQGRWVAMKGAPQQELAEVPNGCRIERVVPLQVPGVNAARSLVIASCERSEGI